MCILCIQEKHAVFYIAIHFPPFSFISPLASIFNCSPKNNLPAYTEQLLKQILCAAKQYKKDDEESAKKLALLKKGMFMNYQHHWIVDNMPVTWCYQVSAYVFFFLQNWIKISMLEAGPGLCRNEFYLWIRIWIFRTGL